MRVRVTVSWRQEDTSSTQRLTLLTQLPWPAAQVYYRRGQYSPLHIMCIPSTLQLLVHIEMPSPTAVSPGLSEKEVRAQLAEQMVDILNPGSLKQWKGDLVPERLRSLEKKREREAAARRDRERQTREKLELLKQQANAAAEEVRAQE